jgi:hypothetical protein
MKQLFVVQINVAVVFAVVTRFNSLFHSLSSDHRSQISCYGNISLGVRITF